MAIELAGPVPGTGVDTGIIWVPLATTHRRIARLLQLPERLELARTATNRLGSLATRTALSDEPNWSANAGALCALGMTAWEELRSTTHGDEARRGIELLAHLQYKVVLSVSSWSRPAWWGSAVHDQQQALLITRNPSYERIFAEAIQHHPTGSAR